MADELTQAIDKGLTRAVGFQTSQEADRSLTSRDPEQLLRVKSALDRQAASRKRTNAGPRVLLADFSDG